MSMASSISLRIFKAVWSPQSKQQYYMITGFARAVAPGDIQLQTSP